MFEHESPQKVKLGDVYQYPINGSGKSSYKLEFENSFMMKEVLYVLGLKKNILSFSTFDAKGRIVAFVDVQVLMCPKGKTIDDATIIGEQDRGMYKLKGHPEQELVHESIEPSENYGTECLHMCIIVH